MNTLAERVEAADGPDRAIDYDIAHLTGDHFRNNGKAPAYTASIDSALTLLPDGWGGAIHFSENRQHNTAALGRSHPTNANAYGEGKTPALALLAAILRARQDTQGEVT